jgi:hypothetical protein
VITLLVKGSGMSGLAKHIANAMGAPLCGNHLKLEDWHIEQHPTVTGVICYQCRRIAAARAVQSPQATHSPRSTAEQPSSGSTPLDCFSEPTPQ